MKCVYGIMLLCDRQKKTKELQIITKALKWKLHQVHLLNKVKNFLVVHKLYVAPINFFLCIFFLFHLKHVLFMEQI